MDIGVVIVRYLVIYLIFKKLSQVTSTFIKMKINGALWSRIHSFEGVFITADVWKSANVANNTDSPARNEGNTKINNLTLLKKRLFIERR